MEWLPQAQRGGFVESGPDPCFSSGTGFEQGRKSVFHRQPLSRARSGNSSGVCPVFRDPEMSPCPKWVPPAAPTCDRSSHPARCLQEKQGQKQRGNCERLRQENFGILGSKEGFGRMQLLVEHHQLRVFLHPSFVSLGFFVP